MTQLHQSAWCGSAVGAPYRAAQPHRRRTKGNHNYLQAVRAPHLRPQRLHLTTTITTGNGLPARTTTTTTNPHSRCLVSRPFPPDEDGLLAPARVTSTADEDLVSQDREDHRSTLVSPILGGIPTPSSGEGLGGLSRSSTGAEVGYSPTPMHLRRHGTTGVEGTRAPPHISGKPGNLEGLLEIDRECPSPEGAAPVGGCDRECPSPEGATPVGGKLLLQLPKSGSEGGECPAPAGATLQNPRGGAECKQSTTIPTQNSTGRSQIFPATFLSNYS